MSKPRHQPRSETDLKLRLRLPTDGSVDLDKLRAALEARLQKTPAPEIVEVPEPEVVVPDPEPEVVLPEPQAPRQPLGFKVWLNTSAPTHILIFSGTLAAIVGSVYFGLAIIGDSKVPSLLGWAFWSCLLVAVVALGFVYFRQLEKEDSLASLSWKWIENNQKKAGITALVCVGLIVVAFLGLTVWQAPSNDSPSPIAKKKTDSPKKTVVIPPVPPQNPPAPITPESDEPVVTESFRPEKGFGGRLMGVLGMGVVIGCGLFQLKRVRRKIYPDAESFQAASKTEYFGFTRGFRTFIASQGAYVLVSAAVATPLAFVWTGGVFSDANVLGFLLGIFLGTGVSFLIVLGAGAAGLDLMPPLDNYISPSSGGSTVPRFVKRKVWQIILGGMVLGGLGYAWFQAPLSDWVGLFLKRGLVWGQLVAVFWWSSTFWSIKVNKDRKVPVLPLKKPVKMLPTKWVPAPAFILFNLPLLIVLGCLLALLPVVFGAPARWLWLYFPLGIAVAIALSALVKRHPRLLRRWRELVFFPALVAMALGLFFGSDSFFIIFLLVLGMMVVGVSSTNSKKTEESVEGILVLPEKRGDYRPVINPDRSGVQIRWASLLGIVLVVLMLLSSSGFFVWNGL